MSRYTRARNASELTRRVVIGDGKRDFDRAYAVRPPGDAPAVGVVREVREVDQGCPAQYAFAVRDAGADAFGQFASPGAPRRSRFAQGAEQSEQGAGASIARCPELASALS